MKFTYLIGAGASANTIPVINNFSNGLFQFAEYIHDFVFYQSNFPDNYNFNKSLGEHKNQFVDDIRWLANECDEHSSVDTFARKLYLSNRDDELLKLKSIVSEFLLTKQHQNGIDNRYDAFFAALLEKNAVDGLMLPKNINVISWNYDKQIEYSIAQFQNKKDSRFIEEFLEVHPRFGKSEPSYDKFSLFKLNGTIGGKISESGTYQPMKIDYSHIGENISSDIEQTIFLNIMVRQAELENLILNKNYYKGQEFETFPTIMYSWENDEIFKNVRDNAIKAISDTEILIIIGYSFPTFNRKIDKELLKSMPMLRKVFIQSPNDSIDGVIQRYKSLSEMGNNYPLFPITNVDEFYIPFEFN